MTPVHWRRAGAGDAPALSLLGGATFLASFAHDHPGIALVDHALNAHSQAFYTAALADPDQVVIIGETPLGAPVGYALLTRPTIPVEAAPADYELKRIYLLGPWQGGGLGEHLLGLAINAARERGTKRLLLAVYPQNEKARRFYARHGFEHIGRMTFMVGDVPFEDLVYARQL
ncbi:GNAT family N-acetyltransferase [soil metagenome]